MKKVYAVLLTILALSGVLQAQDSQRRYIAEDIAAVVGDEIILSSELKFSIQQYALEAGIKMEDTTALKKAAEQVLSDEIGEKVLLHHARLANVEVSDEEVNELVENQIQDLRKRYRTEDEFLRDLKNAGQTILGLQEMYRKKAREDLLQQTYLRDHSTEFPLVKVDEAEARKFFDSQEVGTQPERVKFMHMVLAPKPSDEVVEKAKTRIDSVYKKYIEGADFGYLAEHYSDGPSASRGGDLGYFSKGEMVKEFEEAAFSMRPGEVRMVKTKFGWHLIRVEARRQKEVRARHVLAATEITEEDWERSTRFAESIRQRVIDGESFYDLAKEYSEDADELFESPPFMEFPSLEKSVQDALKGPMTAVKDTTFTISNVIEVRPQGQLLVLEMDHKDPSPLTYQEVRQQIIDRLQQSKAIEAFVEKLKEKTYIDIRFKGWSPGAGG